MNWRSPVAAVAVLAGCAITACAPDPGDAARPPDLAVTDVGHLQGAVDGDVVRFRGVPYARPPVGDLRWAPPEPVAAWEGVRDATAPSSPCAQPAGDYPAVVTEDCLTVDVTAPLTGGSNRPVMVWLHGGGFSAGSGSEYDPRRMVIQGDVVVVSVEFRLGALGFLALPGMADGGALGFADQQEALRFLRRNAAAFGGDPNNITLFGESGGGLGTCAQVASPRAAELFDRAIPQSAGPCIGSIDAGGAGPRVPEVPYFVPIEVAQQASLAASARLGCADPVTALQCLRALPVERVLTEHANLGVAAYGGEDAVLPMAPIEAFRTGRAARVPVLSGFTRDEAGVFVPFTVNAFGAPPPSATDYPALITADYGDLAERVLAEYPLDDYDDAVDAWTAVHSDRAWACPQLVINDALATQTTVYGYEFADSGAPTLFVSEGLDEGAWHGSELFYLFDLRDPGGGARTESIRRPLTPVQMELAAEMIQVWTTFARTGDPGTPAWSPPEFRDAVVFGGATPTADLWAQHRCDFWAEDIAENR